MQNKLSSEIWGELGLWLRAQQYACAISILRYDARLRNELIVEISLGVIPWDLIPATINLPIKDLFHDEHHDPDKLIKLKDDYRTAISDALQSYAEKHLELRIIEIVDPDNVRAVVKYKGKGGMTLLHHLVPIKDLTDKLPTKT
jgi:hypothetical protein